MGYTLTNTEFIILLTYLLIAHLIWKYLLKKNKGKIKDYVAQANSYFVSYILILPLILIFNKATFQNISLKTISIYAFPIFVFIYLFFVIFLYYKNKRNKNDVDSY
jgi:L-asparagine transporter-like permease